MLFLKNFFLGLYSRNRRHGWPPSCPRKGVRTDFWQIFLHETKLPRVNVAQYLCSRDLAPGVLRKGGYPVASPTPRVGRGSLCSHRHQSTPKRSPGGTRVLWGSHNRKTGVLTVYRSTRTSTGGREYPSSLVHPGVSRTPSNTSSMSLDLDPLTKENKEEYKSFYIIQIRIFLRASYTSSVVVYDPTRVLRHQSLQSPQGTGFRWIPGSERTPVL